MKTRMGEITRIGERLKELDRDAQCEIYFKTCAGIWDERLGEQPDGWERKKATTRRERKLEKELQYYRIPMMSQMQHELAYLIERTLVGAAELLFWQYRYLFGDGYTREQFELQKEHILFSRNIRRDLLLQPQPRPDRK